MYLGVSVIGKENKEREVEAYRWHAWAEVIGKYNSMTGEPDSYGDIMIWKMDSEYHALSQRDRLSSGWHAAYVADTVEDVLGLFVKDFA
jgi:hypothetical protein